MPDLPAATANAGVQAKLTPGATYYFSQHTADPGTTGANEVTGGGYVRQAITFTTAVDGVMTSTDSQSFSSMPAAPGGLWGGLWTAATGGTFIWGGPTAMSAAVGSGQTVAYNAGSITASDT